MNQRFIVKMIMEKARAIKPDHSERAAIVKHNKALAKKLSKVTTVRVTFTVDDSNYVQVCTQKIDREKLGFKKYDGDTSFQHVLLTERAYLYPNQAKWAKEKLDQFTLLLVGGMKDPAMQAFLATLL